VGHPLQFFSAGKMATNVNSSGTKYYLYPVPACFHVCVQNAAGSDFDRSQLGHSRPDANHPLSILVSVLENEPNMPTNLPVLEIRPTLLPGTAVAAKPAPKPPANKPAAKRKVNGTRGYVGVAAGTEESKPVQTQKAARKEGAGSRVPSEECRSEKSDETPTMRSAEPEKPFPTEAVLGYANCIMKAFNEGKLPALEAEVNRICSDECVVKTQIFKTNDGAPFANRIVPRESIFDYFCAILDSVPDGLFRPLNSKLITNGKIRQVASNFRFSGMTWFLFSFIMPSILVDFFF
jgi:hypothetical protein